MGCKTTLNTNRLRSATFLFALHEEGSKMGGKSKRERERGNITTQSRNYADGMLFEKARTAIFLPLSAANMNFSFQIA